MTDRHLHIAMFGQKHVLSREGGVEIVVKELATRMAERGHKVVCYDRKSAHIGGVSIDSNTNYHGVAIKTVWTFDRKGLAAMSSSFSAAMRSAVSRYDIVHIHAEGPAAMCWIPKLAGKRVIVTIHGLDWERAKWSGFAKRYIKLGEKIAAQRADEIIVLSKDIQNYFYNTYHRKTVYIPNGVNAAICREANEIKKRWGLGKDSYVLYLGRIVPEKGLTYLVKAWKNIKTEKKLVIAGGSSDTQSYMDELIKISPNNVIFTGFQQGQVLEELYSNCYLYCLPSDLEGMPLSLLEAMSYGNCCLVSDIPECVEVVQDMALSFKKADIEDLSKKLQSLLDDKSLVDHYKSKSAEYITTRFNWDTVVEQTLSLYTAQA